MVPLLRPPRTQAVARAQRQQQQRQRQPLLTLDGGAVGAVLEGHDSGSDMDGDGAAGPSQRPRAKRPRQDHGPGSPTPRRRSRQPAAGAPAAAEGEEGEEEEQACPQCGCTQVRQVISARASSMVEWGAAEGLADAGFVSSLLCLVAHVRRVGDPYLTILWRECAPRTQGHARGSHQISCIKTSIFNYRTITLPSRQIKYCMRPQIGQSPFFAKLRID
jgi:hypothetical protein